MKHAALITAYIDFGQLTNLITALGASFNVYLHIDRKSKVPPGVLHGLEELPNVRYLSQEFTINWGSRDHLSAYLRLSEVALGEEENAFFHLLTGQDFPIKSDRHFEAAAAGGTGNYMEHFSLPTPRWNGGGMTRVKYYHLNDLLNAKKHAKWVGRFVRLQQLLKIARPLAAELEPLYGGSTYWSLSREVLQYVIDFTQRDRKLYDRFKYTFCAEEMYFQTVIMNSPHAGKITNDSARYIDWEKGNGESPALLQEADYPAIVNSSSLFARKIAGGETTLTSKLSAHRNEGQIALNPSAAPPCYP